VNPSRRRHCRVQKEEWPSRHPLKFSVALPRALGNTSTNRPRNATFPSDKREQSVVPADADVPPRLEPRDAHAGDDDPADANGLAPKRKLSTPR